MASLEMYNILFYEACDSDISFTAHVTQVDLQQPNQVPDFGAGRDSMSTAPGKLTRPLPWEVLDDRSDDENSIAGVGIFIEE